MRPSRPTRDSRADTAIVRGVYVLRGVPRAEEDGKFSRSPTHRVNAFVTYKESSGQLCLDDPWEAKSGKGARFPTRPRSDTPKRTGLSPFARMWSSGLGDGPRIRVDDSKGRQSAWRERKDPWVNPITERGGSSISGSRKSDPHGFDGLPWDYIRFPEQYRVFRPVVSRAKGSTKTAALRGFLNWRREARATRRASHCRCRAGDDGERGDGDRAIVGELCRW